MKEGTFVFSLNSRKIQIRKSSLHKVYLINKYLFSEGLLKPYIDRSATALPFNIRTLKRYNFSFKGDCQMGRIPKQAKEEGLLSFQWVLKISK